MRKIISIFIAASLVATMLTACNDNKQKPEDSSSTSSTTTPAEVENDTSDNTTEDIENTEPTETDPENTDNETDNTIDELTVSQLIAFTVREAYDPDTLPFIDMFPEELINDRYGLTDDMYDEIACLVPMISTFVDTVLVVKASNGKVSDVEEALKAYHNRLVEDSIQYPMNIEKVNAGQVVVNGDYVAFLMLGAIDERDEATDSERAEFATEQVQIGVDAFNAYFK